YTIDHFAEEERLMTSIAFPGFLAHRAKHLELTRQVEDLLAKFHEGKLVLSMTISTFLTNWLKHHMQEDDVTLIQYLKAHPATRTLSAAAR
ncbi:MAG: hemerythrin domain-containing protein, partial [Terriglobales bacterium]